MASVERFGATALRVETAAPVALWSRLRRHPPPGVIDVVAGADSVLLIYDSVPDAAPVLPEPDAEPERGDPTSGASIDVPVAYDGADLAEVARLAGLAVDEVGRAHAAGRYSVSLVGFSPGFAYLTGTDPRLDVPRLDRPRTSVPAGSVAVAAGLTAVYPQSTPGGWRLIGRTDIALFDPTADSPARLQPGHRVRFRSSRSVGAPAPWPVPSLLRGVRAGPRVEVLSVAVRVTIQDRGRPGWAHAGVPRAGAADRRSADAANRLVGNGADGALMEVTLGGCRVRVTDARRIAVTGAQCDVVVDGLPARSGVALPVPAGAEILLGPARAGVHSYLAVEGGLDVEPVLGSRSTDTLSGLGPAPLAAGDLVGLGPLPGCRPVPGGRSGPGGSTPVPSAGPEVVVGVDVGPAASALGPSGWAQLTSTAWEVGPASDRTGARLLGRRLPGAGSVPSSGVVAGAVQLPPGGQPVVLLRNHPPTGGYPLVAVVDDAGVDTLAQCRPGTRVRFEFSR